MYENQPENVFRLIPPRDDRRPHLLISNVSNFHDMEKFIGQSQVLYIVKSTKLIIKIIKKDVNVHIPLYRILVTIKRSAGERAQITSPINNIEAV